MMLLMTANKMLLFMAIILALSTPTHQFRPIPQGIPRSASSRAKHLYYDDATRSPRLCGQELHRVGSHLIKLVSQCFVLYVDKQFHRNWEDSRLYCQTNHKTDLAQPTDLIALGSYIRDQKITVNPAIHIGGRKEGGDWKWLNGSSIKKGGWRQGEPNNYGAEGEECLEFWLPLNNLNDFGCTRGAGPFICEY